MHPTPAAKDWFRQQQLPPDVLAYLNLIGQQQKAIEKVCGK